MVRCHLILYYSRVLVSARDDAWESVEKMRPIVRPHVSGPLLAAYRFAVLESHTKTEDFYEEDCRHYPFSADVDVSRICREFGTGTGT